MIIHGDGRNIELLEEENLNSMDAFISVTGNSETNIMSCLMANSKNISKTIALVENMDYFKLSHSIGVDNLINKKLLAANTILKYIRRGEVVDITTLNNLDVEIFEFIVKSNSKVANSKIKDSIYSLPELSKNKVKKFNIISCPGCYPTSILLPLIPLIKKNLINIKNIIIDSKSGYSGAGRSVHKKYAKKNLHESLSA